VAQQQARIPRKANKQNHDTSIIGATAPSSKQQPKNADVSSEPQTQPSEPNLPETDDNRKQSADADMDGEPTSPTDGSTNTATLATLDTGGGQHIMQVGSTDTLDITASLISPTSSSKSIPLKDAIGEAGEKTKATADGGPAKKDQKRKEHCDQTRPYPRERESHPEKIVIKKTLTRR
jgi:hypothetical protein